MASPVPPSPSNPGPLPGGLRTDLVEILAAAVVADISVGDSIVMCKSRTDTPGGYTGRGIRALAIGKVKPHDR
jgi:hypothetical protein